MTYISPDRFIEENNARSQQLRRDAQQRHLVKVATAGQPRRRFISRFAIGALVFVRVQFNRRLWFSKPIVLSPSSPTITTKVES